MAGTVHMQICRAVQALLAAAENLADGGVHKGRRKRAMAEQFKRQVHVFLDAAPVSRGEFKGYPNDWTTRVRIECCARSDSETGLDGEDNADDLAKECYALIAADPDLSGLAEDLGPVAMAWDTDESETQIGVVQLAYDVLHRTPSNSIAA